MNSGRAIKKSAGFQQTRLAY